MSEKLQKVLARAGIGSRREMEQVISAGRVSVDGEIAKLGDRVEESAVLRVDGKVIAVRKESEAICRVLAYHKPEGEVCTRKDPEGRPTVFERLPKMRNARWIAVGRLDLNTSGLLLFTTDGELASRLMHPSYELEREYAVRIFGEVTKEMLQNLKKGVMLDDGLASFDSIVNAGGEGQNHWYHVTLHEGKHREVRRLWESQGVLVSRLIRVRYGNTLLPRRLPHGAWMELPLEDVNVLRKTVALDEETRTVLDPSKEKENKPNSHRLRRTADRSRTRQNQRRGNSQTKRKGR
ncbi:23S rRNA pseudouridine(2605) synthase RluB [Echinimonas agarilytica]|uniref:Pseudouridine synthase n=1 Tax=Echinimonas agarilytica TaxID=1215918 RepID=A0AA42B7H4_9GAMM|nr:23S rRNA pseudouridine(2605) synthase RluB [Echinimonas agarilytica]MCM2679749.1 23S rRNA pseudouridine(2605) synthase RluB [Echinimonas agarilytica]